MKRFFEILGAILQALFIRPAYDADPKDHPMNQDEQSPAIPVPPTPTPPTPAPALPEANPPYAPEPKYAWDTPEKARHSVRVICDEEGLPIDVKNDLCATVGAESGWQSYYLEDTGAHKKGDPVKRENIKNNRVWSTDWGIAQVNDHYWVRESKVFPSAQYILDNPEKVIRWMAKLWKVPAQRLWWIAYKNASYKHFL